MGEGRPVYGGFRKENGLSLGVGGHKGENIWLEEGGKGRCFNEDEGVIACEP